MSVMREVRGVQKETLYTGSPSFVRLWVNSSDVACLELFVSDGWGAESLEALLLVIEQGCVSYENYLEE